MWVLERFCNICELHTIIDNELGIVRAELQTIYPNRSINTALQNERVFVYG